MFYGIYTVHILDIKGSLFLLKRKLLSKYESETFVLVSSNAEYMDVSLFILFLNQLTLERTNKKVLSKVS